MPYRYNCDMAGARFQSPSAAPPADPKPEAGPLQTPLHHLRGRSSGHCSALPVLLPRDAVPEPVLSVAQNRSPARVPVRMQLRTPPRGQSEAMQTPPPFPFLARRLIHPEAHHRTRVSAPEPLSRPRMLASAAGQFPRSPEAARAQRSYSSCQIAATTSIPFVLYLFPLRSRTGEHLPADRRRKYPQPRFGIADFPLEMFHPPATDLR